MGVKGLWQLVLPIGRRVSIETLEGKILAIDVSIWWTQFLSVATKQSSKDHEMSSSNSNTSSVILMGFLRRICKLLYHGIRPVMVLDGSTPQIKLRELQRRRRHRQELSLTSETSTQQLAKRIFLQQLRKKQQQQQPTKHSGPNFHLPEEEEEEVSNHETNNNPISTTIHTNNDITDTNNHNNTFITTQDEKVTIHNDLAIAQALQEEEYYEPTNTTTTTTTTSFDENYRDEEGEDEVESIDPNNDSLFEEEEEEEEEENVLNMTKEWNVDTIGSLSMSERKELFESAQKNQRYSSRRQLLNQNTNPSNYSQTQISNFLQSSRLNQTIATLSQQVTNRNNNDNNHAGFLTTTTNNKKSVEVLPSHPTKLKLSSSSSRKKRKRFDPTIWTFAAATTTNTTTPTTTSSVSEDPIELNYDECFNAVTTYKKDTATYNNNINNNNRQISFFQANNNNIINNKRTKKLGCHIMNNYNSINSDDDDLSQSSNMDNKPRMNTKLISSEFHFMNSDAEESSCGDECDIQNLLQNDQNRLVETNNENDKDSGVNDDDDDDDDVDWEDGNDDEEEDINQILSLKDESQPQRDQKGIVAQASSWSLLPPSNQQINSDEMNHTTIHYNTKNNNHESKLFVIKEEKSVGAEKQTKRIQEEEHQQQKQIIDLELIENKDDKGPNNKKLCPNSAHGASKVKEELINTYDPVPMKERDIKKMNNTYDERITIGIDESKLDDSHNTMCNEKDSIIEEEDKDNANAIVDENKVQNNNTSAFEGKIVNHMNDDETSNVSSFVQNLQNEVFQHEQQIRHQRDLDNNNITAEDMKEDIIQLLQLFGIPYVQSPAEAEAQCVTLEQLGLVNGVVTEDSDAFVFGGGMIYKNIFDDKKFVEVYSSRDAEKEIGLTRNEMVALAMLLGGDYTSGVKGVGIVNGMEILQAFSVRESVQDGLTSFRKWLDGFDPLDIVAAEDDIPNDSNYSHFHKKHKLARTRWTAPTNFPDNAVLTAYLNPVVDKSTAQFSWGIPDLDQIRDFCKQKLGWLSEDTDKVVQPIIQRMENKGNSYQTRLDSYFMKYSDNVTFANVRSERLRNVLRERKQKL